MSSMAIDPKIEIDSLVDELMILARISETEPPVVTRVVFSEADLTTSRKGRRPESVR